MTIRWKMTRLVAVFGLVAAISVGCGKGGAPAATSSEARTEGGRTRTDVEATQSPKVPTMQSEAHADSPNANAESSASGASVRPAATDKRADDPTSMRSTARAYREAHRDLENALRAVGTVDCGLACKALASMTRAVQETCSLARDVQEKSECAEEKKTLESAMVRVRNVCGICRDSR